ncbi:unnamed protein product [Sphenostylis stenocarpa]|uniref:Uncharacterized protein n=1 Tax=Sphenostylis stenocarpa TaxID=92480 RepID=A0AA86V8X8_9FABA|nr:unnamed protein product [Sphenostylis stenocarpa]
MVVRHVAEVDVGVDGIFLCGINIKARYLGIDKVTWHFALLRQMNGLPSTITGLVQYFRRLIIWVTGKTATEQNQNIITREPSASSEIP